MCLQFETENLVFDIWDLFNGIGGLVQYASKRYAYFLKILSDMSHFDWSERFGSISTVPILSELMQCKLWTD